MPISSQHQNIYPLARSFVKGHCKKIGLCQKAKWLVTGLLLTLTSSALASQAPSYSTYEARKTYIQAREYLRSGQMTKFRRLQSALHDYPLAPYLTYYDMRRTLSSVDAAAMSNFETQLPNSPLPARLRKAWMKNLGKRGRWQQFLDNYQETTNVELRCYQLRARYRLGDKGDKAAALDAVAPLWIVGKSQPKSCDPLFETWVAAGRLTENMVWQRLTLAINARKSTLATYLLRFLTKNKKLATTYRNLLRQPSGISYQHRYATDSEKSRQVIAYGLSKLSQRDPQKAWDLWQNYQASHQFELVQVSKVEPILRINLAKENIFPPPEFVASSDLAVGLAEGAIRNMNWNQARLWIDQIDLETRQKPKWQYYLARALNEIHENSERANRTLLALAKKRTYYGFLAAQILGVAASLNDNPSKPYPARMEQIKEVPGLTRALELYAVNDIGNARREWLHTFKSLSFDKQIDAAHLAVSTGWIDQSIRSANDAGLRDDIALRFPYPFINTYRYASFITDVRLNFLLGITRQESIFDSSARSSASARGLMQLIPSTAKLVAQRASRPIPSNSDLYDPKTNILLGAHHLARLMARYDNSRPLVAAAYNAGEHRADRWVKGLTDLPMDIWIESIPYKETRNYVKNVMAFSYVYGKRLEEFSPVLLPHEQTVGASSP